MDGVDVFWVWAETCCFILALAEFAPNSATFGVAAALVVRGELLILGPLLAEFS